MPTATRKTLRAARTTINHRLPASSLTMNTTQAAAASAHQTAGVGAGKPACSGPLAGSNRGRNRVTSTTGAAR